MKTRTRHTVFYMALFLAGFTLSAEALTYSQENLVGIENRFSVFVTDFQADGDLTQESVKSLAEKYLAGQGITLVEENAAPPKSIIQINIRKKEDGFEQSNLYVLDVNVYNIATINTTYELRKGTIWEIGSLTIEPGEKFPKDVEREISILLTMLIRDYFTANPN